jgi:plastocyanin
LSTKLRLLGAGALAVAALVPSTAQAATKSVFAGPPKPLKGVAKYADANAFFPKTVKIAKGDTVDFQFRGFHTVFFAKRGTRAPSFESTDGQKLSGFNDAAGQPFWFNGLDRLIVNPLAAFPSGDGIVDRKAADGSGLPDFEGPPAPFSAKFPKPGTYRYVCQVHPGMKGKVSVRKSRKGVPSTSKDQAKVAKQVARITKTLKRLDRFDGPGDNRVRAGNDTVEAALFAFFPKDITIKAGESVTFEMPARSSEIHTASFGPADYLKSINDNLVTPDPGSPAGGPPTLLLNPLAFFPSDPPPALPPYTGSNHGNGFLSTGVLDPFEQSPPPDEAVVTFQTPGTYTYICAIHGPFMDGTVTVTS